MNRIKFQTRACILLALVFLCFISVACTKQEEVYTRYQAEFVGVFDTYIVILGYAKDQQEFQNYVNIMKASLERQHELFDIYNEYDGINNLKTINNNAGVQPVQVSQEIIDLLKLTKEAYEATNGIVNSTLGSVLSIWHSYRMAGINDPDNAKLPAIGNLQEAAQYVNIERLIIDEEANTVFLQDERMSLDLGSIAKGYAVQIAVNEARDAGMESALINVGGNIVSVGKPMDGRRVRWGVGIQDPVMPVEGVRNLVDTIFVNDMAVVSSGDYQRFFIVDGVSYNHIIDPRTLMPANNFAAVTVLHENSGWADILSTVAFILPYEEGKEFLEKHNTDAIWVYHDGTIKMTDGYKQISREFGGFSAVDD